MKEKITHSDLEKIPMKPIALPKHQVELRRALLTSPYWQRKQTNIFLFWKGGEEIMRKRKFASIGIGFAVIALLFIGIIGLMPKNTKTAYAAEVAQKSYNAVVTLKPEQQAELRHKVMGGDPKELLEKAKQAKDLKVLTYDEFVTQQPSPPPGKSPDGKSPELQNLKFLQFTDDDGSTVTLGVDPLTNLPSMILVMHMNPEGASKDTEFRGERGVKFGSSDKNAKVETMMSTDGKGTIIVNGKKYTLPAGTEFSETDDPPSVKMEGNDVYINGVKATLEE
jgi:hypothetical protein